MVYQLERDRAYKLLQDMILGGKIDTDTPLSERKLAEILGMGRTPIREAVRALVHDGLLETRPARGTFVRVLTTDDVREIYEVKLALEGMATYLAAERGVTGELLAYGPKIKAIMDDPESLDVEEIYQLGADFHIDIFHAARNKNLFQVYKPVRMQNAATLTLPAHYDPSWVRHSVGEHLDILAAISSGDSAKAQQVMVDHISGGMAARMRIFQNLKNYIPPTTPKSASEAWAETKEIANGTTDR